MNDNLMTKKQVARFLNMSESSVYRLAKSKIIPQPFSLSANRTVWDRVKLEAWLEKKRKIEDLLNKFSKLI